MEVVRTGNNPTVDIIVPPAQYNKLVKYILRHKLECNDLIRILSILFI